MIGLFSRVSILMALLLFACQGPASLERAAILEPFDIPLEGAGQSDDALARHALLNNAAFQEALSELGFARAQLIEAKQFPNPTLSVLFPLGPKQLEFAGKFPLEALWLRPRRVAAAQLDASTLAQTLTQSGLDLIRDVKLACADVRLAEGQLELSRESNQLLESIAEIADARVLAGDAAELEVAAVRADAALARESVPGAQRNLELAREKLQHLVGAEVSLAPEGIQPSSLTKDADELLRQALAGRPDLRGAELTMEAEGKRIGLAQAQIFALTAVYDANGSGSSFESGPGLELTLPIFHQNQGAVALADAKFRKAALHYATLRDQIATEVRQARIMYHQAAEAYDILENDVLPTLQAAILQAENAYKAGEVAYLSVLESTRKLQEARGRRRQALNHWHRAVAEIEHATGSALKTLSHS